MAEIEKESIVSPTLIGGAVVVAASIAGLCGIEVTATEQGQLVTYATSAITGLAGLFVMGRNLYAKRKKK